MNLGEDILLHLYRILISLRPLGPGVRVPRPHQYETGQEIMIKVQKTPIIGFRKPKTKEYKCTVMEEGADGVVCNIVSQKR